MRFAYQRRGGPLVTWNGRTAPSPTRAGETRSLGSFYPTTRSSSALRRYGVPDWDRPYNATTGGSAMPYQHDRPLGALDIPRPGAPEILDGYESPQPGAAIIHLGHDCTWAEAHRRAHEMMMHGYMPEGAARSYGQTTIGADDPPKPVNDGMIRKTAVLASAYHGVRRHNGSVMWGLLWALAAYVTPLNGLLVPAFGVAQGFGQAKPKSNPAFIKSVVKRRRKIGAHAGRTKRMPSKTKRKTALYIRAERKTKRGW